ncbi:hybrid sensor histidine kinase/response regulator [Gilvimarinus sp. F26214L]|uniref:hybrid sensor histidine kinase/response regulator n=1 Tax=Gilvimarinus sp. DZF01 TaxID=3461371 RepID=UPI004046737B
MGGKRAGAAQAKSSAHYRAIVENQTELVCRFRADGSIVFVNGAYARARGVPAEALRGSSCFDLLPDEDCEHVRELLLSLRPTAAETSFENRVITPRGTLWVLWTARAVSFDSRGIPREFQASGVDITARKQMELALRESEERLHLALQAARAGAWSVDLLSGRATASAELANLYGYEGNVLPNVEAWLERVHPGDRERLQETLQQRLASADTEYQQEYRIRHPRRGLRWILDTGRIERNDDGQALRLYGVNMDITERKMGEEALRESEHRFRQLAEAVPTLVWASREDGYVVYVNPRWVEYTGQSPEEARGFGWLSLIHPDDVEPTRKFWEHCVLTGQEYTGEVRYLRRDGHYRWHHFKAVRILDSEGAISGWYGAALDVHEQHLAEEALRGSESKLRMLADDAPVILWLTNSDASTVFLSRGWFDYTGQNEESALGMGWLAAVHPADLERCKELFFGAYQTREAFQFDYRARRADGEYRWVLDKGRPRFGSQHGEFLGFIGCVIDVDERRHMEDSLRESEGLFRTLADNMSQLSWMADPHGWVFWFNRRWQEYTGVSTEDAQGWGWTELIHPQHRDRVVRRMQQCWESGEEWEDIYLLRRRDEQYRWFLSRAQPIRDLRGRITRWLGTHTDITEQRVVEETLKQADQRKNDFLATLAHELRNPLAPLRNGLEIMRLASENLESVDRARAMMERQLEHMVRLIDDLLDLSRISRGKIVLHKKRVPLASVVEQAVETSRPAIEAMGHTLTVSLPNEPLYVSADPTRMSQVFSNLLNNAGKFTERGGKIWLIVEARDHEAEFCVRDNGIGIAPEMLGQVFDMFTQGDPTLERTHSGLGIGLSLVRGLVEMHGGSVQAHSDGIGLGSEFVVRLPVVEAEVGDPGAPVPKAPDARTKRRVLVADDNEDSAQSMATMLELLGNETQTAQDGLEALGIAASFRPDVALLDIGMPKLNGYDVARRIREHRWGEHMCLVALTGWGQDEDRRRSREAGFDFHLVKPVDLSTVEKLLSGDLES